MPRASAGSMSCWSGDDRFARSMQKPVQAVEKFRTLGIDFIS
jgi:hypothetical protein